MKTVHILTNKRLRIPDYAVTPLRHNKKALYDRGYKIKIFYTPGEKCFSCNILCFISKPTLGILQMMRPDADPIYKKPHPVISFIENARKYADRVIWMDDSDSTGVTHFELLPYVDLYLKKQLFKDKTLYQREFYGGRIWSDFYHSEFGVVDSLPFKQFYPLDPNLAHKVRLSWNIGLGDMYDSHSQTDRFRRLIPDYWPVDYNVPCTDPQEKRNFDLFVRMSTNLSRETLAFHRQESLRRLNEITHKGNRLKVSTPDWLSLREYRETMRNSKIAPSPFGWGEIGVRDYEAFISGASLLKPSVDHMETWPDIFTEGVTYQPFSWGFEDIESAIYELLEDDKKRIAIARNGQQAYLDSISPSGMEKFCDWFIKQIEK